MLEVSRVTSGSWNCCCLGTLRGTQSFGLGQFGPVVSEGGNGSSHESMTFTLALCCFVQRCPESCPCSGTAGLEESWVMCPGIQRNLSHALLSSWATPACLMQPFLVQLKLLLNTDKSPQDKGSCVGWMQSLHFPAKAVASQGRLCC